jgi:hypothetical protein
MATTVNRTTYSDAEVQAALAVAARVPGVTGAEVTYYAVWVSGASKWVCIACATVNDQGAPLQRHVCSSCGAVLAP